jgi:hypothetical protein
MNRGRHSRRTAARVVKPPPDRPSYDRRRWYLSFWGIGGPLTFPESGLCVPYSQGLSAPVLMV